MIVKLKSWEDAKKAEVKNYEPWSDNVCFGISRNRIPWGTFVKVDYISYNKNLYQYDEFHIPSWLVDVVGEDDVLRYGTILIDRSFTTNDGGYTRIRIIEFCGAYFYHSMVNGEVIECVELGNGESKN